MVEYVTLALALVGAVSAAISSVVAYGFWTGRWAAKTESAGQLLEERLNGRVAALVTRFDAKLDSLQEMIAYRSQHAEKEHATLFARLDKLDEVTYDLQRQIDLGK